MPGKTPAKSYKVKAKPTPKKPTQKTDADKIRALEKNLAQREVELARLSNENQLLIKETEQRATELQIINNIGQTLSEGLDLSTTLERVGDRLREALKIESIGIIANDTRTGLAISHFIYLKGKRVIPDRYSLSKNMLFMRFVERTGGKPVVINTNVEKNWRKFLADSPEWAEIPKAFVMVPLLAGGELVGSITIPDYEREDVFTNLPINMLETIASNMGTAIQNVRLFDETQRLLKQTEQRATELQIINNIGQTLTESGDLENMIRRVGERIQEALNVKGIVISVFDEKTGRMLAPYMVHDGKYIELTDENFDTKRFKLAMRASARAGGRSWVVNKDAEKSWQKWWAYRVEDKAPKSFATLPLLAGREVIGGITIVDYENENAFSDLSMNLLETIASNTGTAVQNVRLFDETQRLLKQTEQRATELQIINNIGQTLTEGLDLHNTLEYVTDRLREVLRVENIGITIANPNTDIVIAQYFHSDRASFAADRFSIKKYRLGIRLSMKGKGRSWVVNTNIEKSWHKFAGDFFEDDPVPKSFILLPLLAGKDAIGGITIADFENENAFDDISTNMLETIAANMGTAVQNARLFDETQRLLKETEQRATELQIINNIGQTLTEGLDLNSTLERVGERLREALDVKSLAIIAFDPQTGLAISNYMYHYGRRIIPQRFSMNNYQYSMRFALKVGSKPWVVNTNAERYWKKFIADIVTEWTETPKSFVILPMLAGRELVGSITISDYEKENAFTDLPINLLETIASNMGTAIQNVRLFDETQRLLKETDQRATELQIINNIGQTLTEGGDLSSTIQRVGDRLREALKVKNIGFSVWDEKLENIVAKYYYRNGKPASSETWLAGDVKTALRLAARGGGRSWVVNRNAEKSWRKFGGVNEVDAPKSFVQLPLLAGGKLVGGITIADYEKEDAFTDLSVGMLETISSNMGTAIQNARLFDETQRLLKQTEQRATELQIINNIGQTLTESGDLENMIQRVGERIQEALNVNNIAISIFDQETDHVIAPYMVRNGEQIKLTEENFDLKRYKMFIRAWARAGGRGTSWAIIKDVDKVWRKSWRGAVADDVPKSLVALPLLAGGEIIGGISLADYEREDAFADISTGMLEIIAANMGTAIQNVRLFEETKRLFAEAEESRAAAEQANKAKSTFLANMSHELRTPLNAIMGFTQIVKGKAEGVMPEKQVNNLEKVLTSSQHLLGLINTVLDIAKIEAGRMDVIPAKFSLSILADQCAALAAPLLKPNVLLEKQVDESIGFVFSDQDKIKQIVLNLLSNAAKFTHEGKVILKVEKIDGENAAISVADSGIGISKEAVGRVFEEFQQADNTTTRQYGGTGLGLTISRNLALLLGGDLTAASELGKGSTFTLTFPMHYKKDPALRHGSASQDSASSAAIMDTVHSAETTPIESSNQIERRSEPQPRTTILVVEDTELNVNFITQLLEDDYELIFAKNGAQGVTLAGLEKPDLILMDISLPIMDGYEATRRIRINNTDTPIIGLSAYAMVGDAEKAKEAGCNDYITKPVDGNLLRKKIKEHLR